MLLMIISSTNLVDKHIFKLERLLLPLPYLFNFFLRFEAFSGPALLAGTLRGSPIILIFFKFNFFLGVCSSTLLERDIIYVRFSCDLVRGVWLLAFSPENMDPDPE